MGDSVDDLDYMLPANCPSPYFDTWDRHNSIAFSATKGLRNAPGENNCFVNCAVQVFWHLDVFRRSYRRMLGHLCMGNSCIFCALKVIFTQFQYSDKSSLHPDALRKALAETFANQQRFQLGHMDDAAECFENILRRIHWHITCGHNEDTCTEPHCLPHQKFSMAIYEKVVCPCGASSSPLKFTEMVHYVSASALVAQSRMMRETGDALHPDRFGLLLRKASSMGDVRDCPANCGKQVQKQRALLNIPDVVSVGLVWDSDHPSVETTTEVAAALGTAIFLQDMYHKVMQDVRKLPRLQLVALVCYYGKHYSTFVFHSKLKTWIYFDDATVREIGPHWENVVDKCSKGRFQPLLLLYANQSAVPVNVDSAPRKRIMAHGYAPVPNSEDGDSGLDKTQDSIKSSAPGIKRSITPNPTLDPQGQGQRQGTDGSGSHEAGRDSPARLSREHSRQPSFLYAVQGKNDKHKMGEGGEGIVLAGGAASNRRQLFDGGASSHRLETMAEDASDYTDYTLSGGNQYRRPSLNGALEANQLPLPPNTGRYPDTQRKDSFTKRVSGKEKGVDVVRYQLEQGRSSNHIPDFTHQSDGFPPPPPMTHVIKSPLHHGRQQSLSSGLQDEGIDMSGPGSHVVVKPKPTGHNNYDTVDGLSHSSVQSGLATIPRHKGHSTENLAPQPVRQTSHQEVAMINRKTNLQPRPVDPPLPPGTPPPEYTSVTQDNSQVHSRQTSVSSQASTIKSCMSVSSNASTIKGSVSMGHLDLASKKGDSEKEKAKKKTKKDKKEKDKEKDKDKKSSGDKKKSKSDSALKKSESESDLTGEKSKSYIDRRMVETILKHQGMGMGVSVHRQNSSCSNSSVDSDSLMGKLLANKASNLTVDIPYDNMSIGSQKDSGYGSSDRNSSSSTGSGTIDPYTQYFISKSMVVPRSVNTQHLMDHQQYQKGQQDHYGSQGHSLTSHSNGTRDDNRVIMHPIKESSQEDILRLSPIEPIGTQKFIIANTGMPPTDARPPPVPPKNFAQFQIIKSSQSAHERESSLDSLDKDDTISDRFLSLCKKADSLMDNCMLAETQDDIALALRYCNSALGCLKEAMSYKDLNSKALGYVQKKHNSCLLKSRTLQKRTMRQESLSSGIGSDIPSSSSGNRSSITSSDSDMSDQMTRQLRPDSNNKQGTMMLPQQYGMESQNRPSHERQNSSSRMGQMPAGGPNMQGQRAAGQMLQYGVAAGHQRTDSSGLNGGAGHMPHSYSANYIHPSVTAGNNSGNCGESGGGSADLYGTLPRNKSRKPSSEAAASPEVYQSFLHKQKCLQAGVGSSQQSLDSLKSDSSSEHSAGSNSNKISKSEIRQLLQDNFVQRQRQHVSAAQQLANAQQQHAQQQQQWQQQQYPQQQQQQYPQQQQQQYPQQQQQQQYVQQQQQQYPQQQQQQQYPQQQQMYHNQPDGRQNGQPYPGIAPKPNPQSQNYAWQQAQKQYPPQQQQQYQLPQQQYPQQPQQRTGPPPTGYMSQPLSGQSGPRPPVPGQKPSLPVHPSRPAGSQGPAVLQQQQEQYPPPTAQRPDNAREVGRRPVTTAPNVARVTPNSHVMPTTASNGGNYLVMMPLSSLSSSSSSQPLGGTLRHTTSIVHLAPGVKPLERCASQPDCQKLVDSTSSYPANLSDEGYKTYMAGYKQPMVSSLPFSHISERLQGEQPLSGDVDADGSSVSVRALLSRFENAPPVPGGQGHGSRPCSRNGSVRTEDGDRPSGTVQRTRSKSESFSRKPKSVLKNKKSKGKPSKSVTFADSLANYANDDASGYESCRELSTPRLSLDDRAYHSDDEDRMVSHVSYSDNDLDDVEDTGSSNSDESPLGEDERACQLCSKRRVEDGKLFCGKCSFYMGKLKSS